MKFTIFLLTISLFVSCANEPIKPYNLNKTEIEKAQKSYENSTIQRQKVQSKSIITITKNETKVLAMIEIYQNWELDSLEERFEPIEDEAKAVLTYFDDEYEIIPNVTKIEYIKEINDYIRFFGLTINKGKMKSVDRTSDNELILHDIDYNGIKLDKEFSYSIGSTEAYEIRSYLNDNNIIILEATSGSIINGFFDSHHNLYIEFNSLIITEPTDFEKL